MRRFAKKQVRRPKEKIRADGEVEKFYPNSISHAMLAIQQFWIRTQRTSDKSRLSHDDFCAQTDFVQVYKRVIERYKGDKSKPQTQKTIASMVNDIAVGRHQIQYYRLRTIAEFVGLPTGLFLIYTHCLGDQRRATDDGRNPHDACLNLIEGVIRVAEVAKQYIEADKKVGGNLFMKNYDDDPKLYLPDVDILKRWANAFEEKSLDLDASPKSD